MTENTGRPRDGHRNGNRERELLSALMDGEASEHELRQALKAVGDDPALAGTWARWHVAQSTLRGETLPPARIDLRAAVAAAIAAESAPVRAPLRPWLKPVASMAVAAGVAALTVVGWQVLRVDGGYGANTLAGAGQQQEIQTVALGPMVVVREDGEELVLPGTADGDFGAAPTAGQDRLNAYLARHAQAASLGSARGLAPYARVVSLEGEQGPVAPVASDGAPAPVPVSAP